VRGGPISFQLDIHLESDFISDEIALTVYHTLFGVQIEDHETFFSEHYTGYSPFTDNHADLLWRGILPIVFDREVILEGL
jgi:hypothetical protein